MRSSSVNAASRCSGSSQSNGLDSSRAGAWAVLCSALMRSLCKEFENGLLIDLVAHRRHVIAAGHGYRAAMGESRRQRIGRPGQKIVFAAHHQNRILHTAEFALAEDVAAAAHAGGERKPVLACLI